MTYSLSKMYEVKSGSSWVLDASAAAGAVTLTAATNNRHLKARANSLLAVIGLTFTGGNPQGGSFDVAAGAIQAEIAVSRVVSCTFEDNQAINGGAITHDYGRTTIVASSFTNNFGGANDYAGGAIYHYAGILTILASNFTQNGADNVSIPHLYPRMCACASLSRKTAPVPNPVVNLALRTHAQAGAIAAYGSITLDAQGSRFVGNSAPKDGGAGA